MWFQIPHGKGNFEGGEGAALGHSAVSCAKMAELIKTPFGFRNQVGPRNHGLHRDWGPDPTWEGAILRGKGSARCKV